MTSNFYNGLCTAELSIIGSGSSMVLSVKELSFIQDIVASQSLAELQQKLKPKFHAATKPVLTNTQNNEEGVQHRLSQLNLPEEMVDALVNGEDIYQPLYNQKVDYSIGAIKMPVGVVGPIRINGNHASGDFHIPLATSDTSLINFFHRGARLVSAAGGISTSLLNESVCAIATLEFDTLAEVGQFVAWMSVEEHQLQALIRPQLDHVELKEIRLRVEGNHVTMIFDFQQGDHQGRDVINQASQRLFYHLRSYSPVHCRRAFLSGHDRIHETQGEASGKCVTAEVQLTNKQIASFLDTDAESMVQYWQMSHCASQTTGSVGHFSQGLMALMLATGQNLGAHGQGIQGMSRLELKPNGDLYASLTLNNLLVGTQGGASDLPTQQACLDICGLNQPGQSKAFAELVTSAMLAGELSILGALSIHHLYY